jgi:hypothetical protein
VNDWTSFIASRAPPLLVAFGACRGELSASGFTLWSEAMTAFKVQPHGVARLA